MKAFEYVNAANEREAVSALKVDGIALPMAGGQDLLARMKDYIDSPDRVVNIKGALDAAVTQMPDGGLKIGAAMKIIDLFEHPQVRRLYPAVNAAAIEVGTPQIRHQGTVGGNVNQRPRCWYFRNEEFVCYKKGGSRCFAVNGENQYHAIFGNEGPSHIVHPSSLAVPFVAYGAKFRIVGPNGEREIAAADFFTMPTLQNVMKENVLGDEELLTHVILPAPGNVKTGHYEVRYKASHDWPLAFSTVVLTMNGARVNSARVVLGAVAPVPWRSKPAEAALAGKTLDEAAADAAGQAAVTEAKPMSGNEYKVQIAKIAVKRAVMRAAGLATV
ncbi:MAG TPA: FAD binding domain-containing protein [Vicinamibacterales bacterium]|nr:FAD binding domain-containing protein [Vicinamibacterales bacterium]